MLDGRPLGGVLGLDGSTDGGGTSGAPGGGWLKGVHTISPRPMASVTDEEMTLVVIVTSVAYPEMIVGINVSVTTWDPTLPMTTVPPDGRGTLDPGGGTTAEDDPEEALGTEGAGTFGRLLA